jgi:membrane-associated phospholipid phosphatase
MERWLRPALALDLAAFVALALLARGGALLPVDIAISRAIQAYHPAWLDQLTGAISWTGYVPQVDIVVALIAVLLFLAGLRRAALGTLVAGAGGGALYLAVQQLVAEPRPNPDLVRVIGGAQLSAFPSGHIATYTAVLGFLVYLAHDHAWPRRARCLPAVVGAGLVVAMAFSRVYAGHHWASDVVGGFLLGAAWLVVPIRLYQAVGRREAARLASPAVR